MSFHEISLEGNPPCPVVSDGILTTFESLLSPQEHVKELDALGKAAGTECEPETFQASQSGQGARRVAMSLSCRSARQYIQGEQGVDFGLKALWC